jgi:uncharacterized protein (TIGR02646 family)
VAEGREHVADAAVYAHDEVRKALERLFNRKCAYCESCVENFDVDHLRPKGRVAERKNHPGYYWLAYTWSNLYPSCQACNQRRRDRPLWGDARSGSTAGKADQFPLSDEDTRAMTPADDLARETTELIDPCGVDPEQFLSYDPLGGISSLQDNPQGKATIRVFHLDRRRLKDARREVISMVTSLAKLAVGIPGPPEAVSELRALLSREQGGAAPYAGLARYVAAHLTEFGV